MGIAVDRLNRAAAIAEGVGQPPVCLTQLDQFAAGERSAALKEFEPARDLVENLEQRKFSLGCSRTIAA